MHYSPTPATVRIGIRLVTTAAAKGEELRRFDAEKTFLKADTVEEVYMRSSTSIGVSGGSAVAEQGDLRTRTGRKVLKQ